jgi:mono/diheme cytochrome c family protein
MPTFKLIRSLGAPVVAGLFVALASAPAPAAQCEDPLLADGRILFEETAGGVGCAVCHGPAGVGDPETGAPFIQGVSKAQLDAALDGGVPDMDFFDLKRPDKKALLAFLQSLKDEPVAPANPEDVAIEADC